MEIINKQPNIKQKGGNQPNVRLLKDINLFKSGSSEEYLLNPTWGYIWLNSGILINYKFLKVDDDIYLNRFIKKFIQIIDVNDGSIVTNEQPKPTNALKDHLLPNKLVGNYLALKYIQTTERYKFAIETINLIKLKKQLKTIKINKIFKDSVGIKRFFLLNPEIKAKIIKEYPITTFDRFESDWKLFSSPIKELLINTIEEEKINKYQKLSIKIEILNDKLVEYEFKKADTKINDIEIEKSINSYLKFISSKMDELIKWNHKDKPKFKPFKEFERKWKDVDDERYFYVILAIMWFNSTNKNDIKEYYDGLAELNINFKIPDDWSVWISSIYSKELTLINSDVNTYFMEIENYEEKPFNQLLAISHINYKNPFTIIDYKNVNLLGKVIYPDCGASSLRDFLRILILESNNRYNFKLLEIMGAKNYVIKFFELFNEDYQKLEGASGKINIKSIKDMMKYEGLQHVDTFLEDDENNSRAVWAFITSNIKDVDYRRRFGELENMFEISSDNGNINLLNVIRGLFNNIKEWSDFEIINNYISEENKISIEENFEGPYGFINITKETGVFKYHFKEGHFNISFESKKDINIDFNSLIKTNKLTKEQVFYLKMLSFNIDEINLLYFPSNIFFFKFNNNNELIKLFANYYNNTNYFKDIINKDDYNLLLTMIQYFNRDELSRSYIDIFNLKKDLILGSKYLTYKLHEIIFNNIIFDIMLEEKCHCSISDLNKGKCNICKFSLDDVRSIEFYSMKNEKLDSSLKKNFKNVISIIFPDDFTNGDNLLDDNLYLDKLEHFAYSKPIITQEELNIILKIPNLEIVFLNISYEFTKILEEKNIEVINYLNKKLTCRDGKNLYINLVELQLFNELIDEKDNNKYIYYNDVEQVTINLSDRLNSLNYWVYPTKDYFKYLKIFFNNLRKLNTIILKKDHKFLTGKYYDDFESCIIEIFNDTSNINKLEILYKNNRFIKEDSNIKEEYFNKYLKYKNKYINLKKNLL